MRSLALTDAATLAHQLPAWLDRERNLMPALERLGVPPSELRVLEGDSDLLRILAEESEELSAEASREALQRVLGWHRRRLERLAAQAVRPPGA